MKMYSCPLRTKGGFPKEVDPKDEQVGRGPSSKTGVPTRGHGNARNTSSKQGSDKPNKKRRATIVDDVLIGTDDEDRARAKAYLTSLHVELLISKRPKALELTDNNNPEV
jgi:hypothetical protein